MNPIYSQIYLDLQHKTIESVNLKQYDCESRYICFHLTDNGSPYILTPDIQANIKIHKPDGTRVVNTAIVNVDRNNITVAVTNQMTSVYGVLYADLTLFKDDQVISTMPFHFHIEKSPVQNEDIVSTDEYGVLENLISDVQEKETLRQSNEASRQKNEQSRIAEEEARMCQENQRSTNEAYRQEKESNRISAENIRNKNEQRRISNESVRQEQETIRQEQSTAAIANAQKAAQDAISATTDLQDKLDSHHFVLTEDKDIANGIPSLDANGKVPAAELYDATTSRKGITQLTDSVTSTSTSTAATPNSVKTAYDAAISHTSDKANPHNITKSQIGLGNVDNTSDINKPVSTNQQAAIDLAYTNSNEYTDARIAEIINGAPSTLDTLGEIATAMAENKDVVEALHEAVGTKADRTELNTHTGNNIIHVTASERTQWDSAKSHADSAHAPSNAEANQNSFSKIAVASTAIAARTETDTLTLIAGKNITITPDAANNQITIASTDTKYTHPTSDGNKHVPANGSTNGGKYLKATSTAGKYEWGSLTKSDVTAALGYTPASSSIENITYTLTKSGNTITLTGSDGSTNSVTDNNTNTWRGIQNNLTSSSTTDSLSANQGKILKGLVDGKAASNHTHNYIPTSASCNKNWHWSGQSGQPSWVWGGNEQTDMYVYNPSNFRVNYANSAGNVAWNNVSGKPSTFTPASHTHSYLPLSGGKISGGVEVGGKIEAKQGITIPPNYSLHVGYHNFMSQNSQSFFITPPEGDDFAIFYGVKENMWTLSPFNSNGSQYLRLGTPNARWSQIYSTVSTISTSDRTLKKDITAVSEKYLKLFTLLQPVTYRFIDGASGRIHIGFISQDVEHAMAQVGISDLDFAGFCKDKMTDDAGKDVLDEDGNPVYLYSLRYEEFIALNTAVIQRQQQQIDALQCRMTVLEQAVETLLNKQ